MNDDQQSYDKAKPCTYAQLSRMQFIHCKLNEVSMSPNETYMMAVIGHT